MVKDWLINRIVAGLKARRPPQTMADIPASTRMVARDYVEQVEYMLRERRKIWGSAVWEQEDIKRRMLHRRLIDEFKKIGMVWTTRGQSERIAGAIARRRWRAEKSMSTKARRPPETMTDLPFTLRKAAQEYVEYVDYMMGRRLVRGASEWQRMDIERHALHDQYLDELRKVGIRWKGGGHSEVIARDIVKRKWRAKGRLVAPKLARWVEKAKRLGWHLPREARLSKTQAALFPTSRADPMGVRLSLNDTGAWAVAQGFDKYESGRGNIPTVAQARRMASG